MADDSSPLKRGRSCREMEEDGKEEEEDVEDSVEDAPTVHHMVSNGSSQDEDSEDLPLSLASEMAGLAQKFEELGLLDQDLTECDSLQQRAIDTASQGKNLFLTGRAGTGKSWCTKRIVQALESQHRTIHLVAPTGIAAINIGGITLNSWGRFGTGDTYAAFGNMMSSQVREKIRTADCLLIDEISMLHGHVFDCVEFMISIIRAYEKVSDRLADLRHARRDGDQNSSPGESSTMSRFLLYHRWKSETEGGFRDIEPWGGLQIIVVGDFYQLPPVPGHTSSHKRRRTDTSALRASNEMQEAELHSDFLVGRGSFYAFQSYAWDRTNFCTVELTNVHRQAEHDGLFALLNDMREGAPDLDRRHRNTIRSLTNPLPLRTDGILPTELHSRNINVDQRNKTELKKLAGESRNFRAKDEVLLSAGYKEKLLKKYKLEEVASMSCLWASVEERDVSPELWQARQEAKSLKDKLDTLVEEKRYAEIPQVGTELDKAEEEVKNLEEKEKASSEITLEKIKQHLQMRTGKGNQSEQSASSCARMEDEFFENLNVEQKARDLLRKIQLLLRQARSDFQKLLDHARNRFFGRKIRVGKDFELKRAAQVMLLWNLDVENKLVNGSRGVVTDVILAKEYQSLLEDQLKRLGVAVQECDQEPSTSTSNTPNPSLQMSHEIRDNLKKVIHSFDAEKVLLELKGTRKLLGSVVIPIVRFAQTGDIRAIVPLPFSKEFRGCGIAIRWQLPLSLAWAITIHKSQGMTIDWLKVNLNGCFSFGQAYVACSRGTSVSTMAVENFCPSKVLTSALVKRFFESIQHSNDNNSIPKWDELDDEERKQNELNERYKHLRCEQCGSACMARRCHSNDNGNYGKWYVACRGKYQKYHTFHFIET